MKNLVKKIIILSILGIFCAVSAFKCNRSENYNQLEYSVGKQTDAIRLISYNIRGDSKVDRENGNSWDERKYKIQKLLTYYNPDVIGLQEVSASYIGDLEQLFSDYSIVAFDTNKIDKDVALLIRKDRFDCLKTDYFWLAEDPSNKHSSAWDSRVTRIVVYAKLIDRKTQKEIFVFCTHFDSSSSNARFEGAKLLVKQQKLIAQDAPVIILGDFNLFPDQNAEEIYQEIIVNNELNDIRDKAEQGHFGPDGTWIGWSYDKSAAKSGTIGARLDHIFVNNITVLKEGVLTHKVDPKGNFVYRLDDSYTNTSYPSDHLPIIADILITG